jgi:hypothetical protein
VLHFEPAYKTAAAAELQAGDHHRSSRAPALRRAPVLFQK